MNMLNVLNVSTVSNAQEWLSHNFENFLYEADEAAHIDKIISLLKDQEQIVNEKLIQLQKDSAHVHHKVEYYSEIKHALENNLPLPVWVDEDWFHLFLLSETL